MNPILRNILAVLAGLITGNVVNMTLVTISHSVIPPPAGVDVTTLEGLKASMHLLEGKHFVFPFLAHALGTLAGALVAALLAASHKMRMALIIGLFFLVGGIMVNVMLVLFNAIPAFPMDGGRVLRAVLAMTMDRVKATQIAARIGQFIAILFVLAGLFYVKNPFLILIGVFVFLGAAAEAQSVTTGSILTGFKVRDVIRTKYTLLNSSSTLKNAVDELLAGADQDFLVSENNSIAGILRRKDLLKALSENGNDSPITPYIIRNLPYLKLDDDIKGIYPMMQQNGFSLLPVLDETGNLVGILDLENLAEFVMIRSAIVSKN